jgi:hypothetical protein
VSNVQKQRYRIVGADRATGEEIELFLHASNIDSALKKANDRGILVSACVSVDSGTPMLGGASSAGHVSSPPLPPASVPMPAGPNEIIFPASLPETMAKVAEAINRLGRVTELNQPDQYITGNIKFGFNSVRVRVSLIPAGPNQSRVVLQGMFDGLLGAGARSATRRLMEMLRNLDNPGYVPDRWGMPIHPLVIVGAVVAIIGLILHWIGQVGIAIWGGP